MDRFDLDSVLSNYQPVPEAGCWLWNGAAGNHGYGVVSLGRVGLKESAHRFFYQLHKGPIAPGLCVCHKCDTPGCVNPDHLFLGTNADNMADRRAKGRYNGTWNSRAMLTDAQIREIRATPSNVSNKELAARYGVRRRTIWDIRSSRTWPHLPGASADTYVDTFADACVRNLSKPVPDHRRPTPRGTLHGRARLTPEAVAEIRAHSPYKRGDVLAFANKYGVSRRAINLARAGETWTP